MKTYMLTRAVIAALVVALDAAILTACHSAPTRIFTLYPVSPSSTVPTYHGPLVRIDAVHVPPALDRIEITTTVNPGELKINDLDHWSGPLAQVARQALSRDLASRLPPGMVLAPRLDKPDGALGVNVDITEFTVADGTASLSASWVAKAGANPESSQRIAVLTTPENAGTPASTARTLSELLGQLSDRLADDLAAQYSK